jgi:hypothetical protein
MFSNDCIRAIAMDLKMLGQASFQLVKSKDRKKYVQAKHFPQQTLRPAKCNEKGEIEKYYYCPDWANLKRGHTPIEFRAFGYDQNANECILDNQTIFNGFVLLRTRGLPRRYAICQLGSGDFQFPHQQHHEWFGPINVDKLQQWATTRRG